jgi:hypothetical protein
LGVLFYKDAGARGEQAKCARCKEAFASQMHVNDLIEVERQLGYKYEMPESPVDHYQRICPRCRRISLALAQGQLWNENPHLESWILANRVCYGAFFDHEIIETGGLSRFCSRKTRWTSTDDD